MREVNADTLFYAFLEYDIMLVKKQLMMYTKFPP